MLNNCWLLQLSVTSEKKQHSQKLAVLAKILESDILFKLVFLKACFSSSACDYIGNFWRGSSTTSMFSVILTFVKGELCYHLYLTERGWCQEALACPRLPSEFVSQGLEQRSFQDLADLINDTSCQMHGCSTMIFAVLSLKSSLIIQNIVSLSLHFSHQADIFN